MPRRVTMDFETRSPVDIKAAGAHVYARHPETVILCLCYSFDGGEPRAWIPGMPFPAELAAAAEDPEVLFEAHSAIFEQLIWRYILFGFTHLEPPIPGRWRDTMASAAYRAMPLALKKVARALRLPEQKSDEGTRLINQVCSPDAFGNYNDDPVLRAELHDYCGQDVRTEIGVGLALGDLPPAEQAVWELDQEINERGILVDRPALTHALAVVKQIEEVQLADLARVTGGTVTDVGQIDGIIKFCRAHGTELPNLQKDTVSSVLEQPGLAAPVRATLQVRQRLGQACLKKLPTMEKCLCPDGRVRGLLQYHGAFTGRWAGRLVQPQNYKRPDFCGDDPGRLLDILATWSYEDIQAVIGEPLEVLANALRGLFIAAPGKKFVSADFKSVEARVLMWLAGQDDAVQAFRDGVDLYCDLASKVFGHPVTKREYPKKRGVGKIGILGLGYQMGAPKLYAEGVKAKADPALWMPALANITKETYRATYPMVPALWAGLEQASIEAVLTGRPHAYGRITYFVQTRGAHKWLGCRLPSGRDIWYYDPSVREAPLPWSTAERPASALKLSYWAQKMGRWQHVDTYGGKETENVVQAIARDLMVVAMLRCLREGLPIVLTTHDDILAEPDAGGPGHEVLEQIMVEPIDWADGCPVAAEGWTSDRWRK